MKTLRIVHAALGCLGLLAPALHAQVPQLLNYQGRVAVGTVNFDGSGQFKFALVNAAGTTTFWSNDGTSVAGSQPTAAVALTVTKGLYSVLLGDATLPNMTLVPPSVFNNSDVRLRVWFDDGTNGSQLLTPDQRIAAVGYAMIAENVPDGTITREKIAAGAVGSSQLGFGVVLSENLGTGAVQSSNLATGAVGTAQMADFTVTGSKLRLGTDAGTVADGVLTGDLGAFTFTSRPFAYPFTAPPTVSLSTPGWTLGTVTASGFSANAAYVPVAVNGTGNGILGGVESSLAVVNGNPAISFYGNGGLQYVRATDASGSSWGTPVTADISGYAGLSMVVVNGNPAISYYDLFGDLKFVRALDASGTGWGTPVTVSNDFVNGYTSLVVVNGKPAISSNSGFGALRYVRATDESGTDWDTPVTVVALAGNQHSMAVVNGNPAISFDGNGGLQYVRATDASGSSWGMPVTADSSGKAGSLAVVNGNPAISYCESSNFNLKYVRALDESGTGWDTPATLDNLRAAGGLPSLAVVNGNPVISYHVHDNAFGAINYVRALDANGTGWGPPATVDSDSVGPFVSLAVVKGIAAISYYDSANEILNFVGSPELRWQASDGTVAPLTAATVSAGAIGSPQLAANAVQRSNIAASAVGPAQLADGAVRSGHIYNGAVGPLQIADNSIRNYQIAADAAIVDTKLATLRTAGKVANSATTGTSANTASTLVLRDASGNFTVGTITATSYKLPSPQIFTHQITANGFVVDSPGDSYDRGAGLISPAGGDTLLQFLADVHLPQGATVTKLVGVFSDSNIENFTDIDLRLRYFSTTSLSAVTMAEIVNANTVGISSGRVEFEDNTVTNSVIDNTTRAYMLDISFSVDTATSNTRFYGVRIEYTHDTLSP